MKTFEEQHAEALREKMAAGLTREQATEVIKAQIANDERIAAEEAAAEKRKKAEAPKAPAQP
jgi:hypothetical protein